jgi:hypothetical protein
MPRGKKAAKAASPTVVVSPAVCREAFGKLVVVHPLAVGSSYFRAKLLGYDPFVGMLAFEKSNGTRVFYPVSAVRFEIEPEPEAKATPRCPAKAKTGAQCVLSAGHDGKHKLEAS